MLSPPLCANKVIRIELREADAQEVLRQDAEQLKSMTLGVDPLPKATPAPGRNLPFCPAARCCRSCKPGFWRGLPGGGGPTAVGRRKRVPFPLSRAREASTHQTVLVSPSSPDCGKGRGGREGEWERTQCFSQSVCDRKKEWLNNPEPD